MRYAVARAVPRIRVVGRLGCVTAAVRTCCTTPPVTGSDNRVCAARKCHRCITVIHDTGIRHTARIVVAKADRTIANCTHVALDQAARDRKRSTVLVNATTVLCVITADRSNSLYHH